MPIVFDETLGEEPGALPTAPGAMPNTVGALPTRPRLVRAPSVTPESVAPERALIKQQAQDAVRESFPGIVFTDGDVTEPTPAESGIPGATAAPDEDGWVTLGQKPEKPEAPKVEAPKEKRGFFNNLLRKTADDAGRVLSDMTFQTADTLGEYAPNLDAGLIIDSNGVRWAKGKEYSDQSFVHGVASAIRDPDYQFVDHEDHVKWEDIKAAKENGDYGAMAKGAGLYAVENGISSVPDMIAVLYNAPGYFLGLASRRTQERAQNAGRADAPNASDLAIGSSTAIVETLLEKYGAEKVFDMFKGPKSRLRKWIEGTLAETFTEAAQGTAEEIGTKVGTPKQDFSAGHLGEVAAQNALGGFGGGATIGGGVQLLDKAFGPSEQDVVGQPAPAQKGNTNPQAPAATGTPASQQPAKPTTQAPGAPASPQGAAPTLQPGTVTLYQPEGAPGATPVRIERITGKTGQAVVTSLDENGDPLIVDGEPATYVVQLADLGAPKTTAKPAAPQVNPAAPPAAAAPVAPPAAPGAPTAAPTAGPTSPDGTPDVPSAEPLIDLKGQIADMADPNTPRKGVLLSKDNVDNLKKTKLLDQVTAGTVPVVNFDYRGGTMLFPDQATAEAAVAARDANRKGTAIQQLIGQLTGAGINKPNAGTPTAVVQRVNPQGAVVQESVVPTGAVPATATAMAQPGHATVVTTPEAALARRAQGVAADNAQAPTAPAPVAPAPLKAKAPVAPHQALRDAMAFTASQEVPEANRKNAGSLQTRQANAVGFGLAVETALKHAVAAGVLSDEEVKAAQAAVHDIKALADKSTEATEKGQGTGHAKVTSKMKALAASAQTIAARLEAKQKEAETAPKKADEKPPVAAAKKKLTKAPKAPPLPDVPTETKAETEEEDDEDINVGGGKTRKLSDLARTAATAISRGDLKASPHKVSSHLDVSFADAQKVLERAKTVTKEKKAEAKATETKKAVEAVKPDPAAPAPTTITIAPRKVEGAELKAFLKELGLDPEQIQADAEKEGGSKRAARGALARELEKYLPGVTKEGSWLQRMAGLRTTEDLTDAQKTTIWKAVKDFIGTENVTEAMDTLINKMQGLNLDMKTVEAIGQYAQFMKAFNKLREKTDESADEDGPAAVRGIDYAGNDDLDLDNKPLHNVDEPRTGGIPNSVRNRIEEYRAELTRALRNSSLAQNIMRNYMGRNRVMSSKELLRDLKNLIPEDNYFGPLISRLLKAAPDVPIRFSSPDVSRGRSGGSYQPSEGTIMVHLQPLMKDGKPVTNTAPGMNSQTVPEMDHFVIQTIVHELVHAATVNELRLNKDGPLATKLRRLIEQITRLAEKKYGTDVVAENLKYFTRQGGPPRVFLRQLYGISKPEEMVTEALTNPYFAAELHELGKSNPRDVTAPSTPFLQKIIRAIADFLGVKNPREAWLLQDVLDTSSETMRQQYFRAQADVAQRARIKAELIAAHKEMFGSTDERAREYANETAKAPYGPSRLIDTADLYTMGPEALADKAWGTLYTLQGNGLKSEIASVRDDLENLQEEPIRREAEIRSLAGNTATRVVRQMRALGKTHTMEKVRKAFLALHTFDQIERRRARFFGPEGVGNVLTTLMDVRRSRQSHANVLMERAEKDVNSKWLKLTTQQSHATGQMMIDSTLWQIDPSKDKASQTERVKNRKDFDKRYDQLQQQWQKLSGKEREVYENARDYATHTFNKIRRAAVDLAIDGMSDQELSPAQRSLLYSVRTAEGIDQLVGTGKIIDLGGDANDKFRDALKDVMNLTKIDGPYFPLNRYGDKVVEANKEGQDTYATKDEAEARREQIKSMTPANKATVVKDGDKYTVKYKMNYVAFHKSRAEAEADVERMHGLGFNAEVATEKTTSIASTALTPALQELVSGAKRKLGGENAKEEGTKAIHYALESAFTQILAERAASMGGQLKRAGIAGVKASEMHKGWAERAQSTAWHYANMKTAKAEVAALTELRKSARKEGRGNADQDTMYQRGLTVNEVERHIAIEAQEMGKTGPFGSLLAKLGFANYLLTPSYTFVNSMQNFTVAMPVVGAKYGYGKTSRAFARAMAVAGGTAFSKAIRGTFKPGSTTSYDIYQALEDTLKNDPRYGKYVKGENSAIRQLVDLGVINASFTQELAGVAEGDNRRVQQVLEYARLLPQAAELMNRVSTALAMLELTGGNVNKTADMIRLTHIDYSQANQPRAFKRIGKHSIPRALTMFKMYPQAIWNLFASSTYDAITGAGAPRAQAAKTLAGLVVSHTVAAGVLGGLMLEPLRWMIGAWHALFGDDDEEWDLDAMIRGWLADTLGAKAGDVAAHGIFNALGIDLSSRLGINHLAFYNPPDFTTSDPAKWAQAGFEALGPIPAMMARNLTNFNKAREAGRYRDAFAAMIPIKLVQDANKAYNQVTEGIQTTSGAPIVEAKDVGFARAAAQLAGFRTTQETNVSDKRQAKFKYEDWLGKRKTQLFNSYWSAKGADREEVIAEIKQFNAKNPGSQITSGSLMRSRRSALQQAAQVNGEMMRNPDLKEKLDF